jgi:hypothetical protein
MNQVPYSSHSMNLSTPEANRTKYILCHVAVPTSEVMQRGMRSADDYAKGRVITEVLHQNHAETAGEDQPISRFR